MDESAVTAQVLSLAGPGFLGSLPVSPADRAKIAHGNADRLLRLGGPTGG